MSFLDNIDYEYSSEDRLVFPHTYQFSAFKGHSFLENYFRLRKVILEKLETRLKKERTDVPEITVDMEGLQFHRTLKDLAYVSTEIHYDEAVLKNLKENEGFLDENNRIDTKRTLWAVVVFLGTRGDCLSDMKSILDFFVHKYEVFKKLFPIYNRETNRRSGLHTDMEIYALLSVACLLYYKKCANLKHLNCSLKINDMLCSRAEKLITMPEIFLFHLSIRYERSVVLEIMEREGIHI